MANGKIWIHCEECNSSGCRHVKAMLKAWDEFDKYLKVYFQ